METDFKLTSELRDDVLIMHTSGYVNNEGGEKIAQEFSKHDSQNLKKVIINLEKSKVVNSIGISFLLEVIEKLNEKGKRLVMLMDEFESITTNPNFDMKFFSFLRYLANNFKVAFVTSSYNELQQMCHDKDIADSPFFNIFSNLLLRSFTREEALELIRVPSERETVPLAQYSDRILELSGLFPMFIQIACSNVFEYLVENEGSEPDWGEISTLFEDETRPHFGPGRFCR